MLTDQELNLVVDQANAFKFIVDDIETNMSHVNFKEVATSSAAYSLKDAYDAAVLTEMFTGVSSSSPDHVIGSDSATADATMTHATNSVDLLGSDGTGVDALDLMARMARLLTTNLYLKKADGSLHHLRSTKSYHNLVLSYCLLTLTLVKAQSEMV